MKRLRNPLLCFILLAVASCQPRMPDPEEPERRVSRVDTMRTPLPVQDALAREGVPAAGQTG